MAEIFEKFPVGGAKPPKFPTKRTFKFPTPPPPFALEKSVFSLLFGQIFRKGGRGGGGGAVAPPRFPPLVGRFGGILPQNFCTPRTVFRTFKQIFGYSYFNSPIATPS